MSTVAIIDSGGANLASLRHALERLGARCEVTSDAGAIGAAERVVLPGVGSAGDAMARLARAGLDRLLPSLRQPVLGICLGMQLLCERSAEGEVECLGVVPGRIERLGARADLPVPHMGWNQVEGGSDEPLLRGLDRGSWFYFVHSYALSPGDHTVATTDYGVPLTAVLRRGNYWGVQFHPERSAAAGARLLDNFLSLPCS